MARLYSSGFEVNNLASGWEWNTVAGSVSLSSAVKRSGNYSLRVNPTAGTGSVWVGFLASAGANHYARFYLRIASAPTSDTRIAMLSSGGSQQCGIILKTDRTLQGVGQTDASTIGSPSAQLALDTWYLIEFWGSNPGASTGSSDFRLNGTSWASHTNTTPDIDTYDRFDLGAMTSTTCDIYFDDVAINDTTGTDQNSWPGEGAIVALWPNGDSSLGWATIFPTTPTTHYDKIKADSLDDASSYIEDTTINNLDVFTLDNFTPSADSIKLVETHARWQDVGLSSGVLYVGLGDGTLTNNGQSLDVSGASNWSTDEDHDQYTTVDYRPGLTIYKQLNGSTALNPTYLDSLLLRILNGDGDTYQVTAAWVNVEYVPGAGTIIQKSLGYMIKRTPSALTKSLRYEMVTPVIPIHIDLVQASWSSTSTSFSNIYGYYLHESANFDGSLKAYFQATINTSNASYACSVRLYDVTAAAAVPNTTLSTTSTTWTDQQTTTDIADQLIDGHVYLVQIMTANAVATARCMGARIVIRHKTLKQPTAITNFQPIGVASSVTGAGSDSYTTPPLMPKVLFDGAQYDGTLNVYFEATLYTSGSTASDITYARLWDVTANQAVSGSEVSISGNNGNVQRVRSSAITLTNGNEYVVQIKQAVTGDTAYIYSGHLVYKQTGSIKKTQLHQLVNSIEGSTTSTTFAYFYAGMLFNKAMFANYVSVNAYFEANLKTNNASGITTSNLYDLTNTTTLSGDITTSSLSYVRQRTASFDILTPTSNLDDLKQQLKTNNASYTAYILASRIIYNVQLVSAVAYSIQKSMQYTVKSPVAITKSLKYTAKTTPAATTKGLIYRIRQVAAITKSLWYTVKQAASAVTKSLKYTVWITQAALTKQLAYTVRITPSALTKSLQYAIKRAVSVTKTLQYAVKITPSALTKQLIYAVKTTPAALTKALQYTIKSPVALTKQLIYAVKTTPSALTKSMQYAVRKSTAITKSLQYEILTAVTYTIQKGLQYAIKTSSAITKSLQYTIKSTPSALTKGLQYTVKTTPSAINKSLQYAVKTGIAITKSLQYTVKSAVVITKSLQYTIKQTPAALTKSLQYAIKRGVAITKSLQYTVKTTPSALTKSLQYAVQFGTFSITKSLSYAIKTSSAITKSLQYAVKSSTAITKSLTYRISGQGGTLTKSLQYAIKRSLSLTKSLQYAIKSTPSAITKSLQYAVKNPLSLTKQLMYTVRITPAALTKSLQYAIRATPSAITKSLQYAIKKAASITKSLSYTILTAPSALTKQLQYAIKRTPTATTKQLHYAIIKPTSVQKSLTYDIVAQVVVITKQLKYTVKAPAPHLSKLLTYHIIVGGYVDIYVPQSTLYNEKYNPQGTGYSEKYAAQGTGYSEKYSPQSTGYNELYVPQGTSYTEKYN